MNALPAVERRQSGAEELFVLTPESDDQAFLGHFPDNPILPGVVQVDWAIRLGTEAFGPLGNFRGFWNLKFMSIIRPKERLELRLTLDREAGKLGFRYDGPTDRKSSGVVLFSGSR